ncbi:hormogonium polysaccharide secretion pseudopilin HpsC [Dapis sp. BLCC M229]|uniref:hormogonium polysaccharide secretion pseudopilin HpsC n=1 Tax=Dapis sp. BLCC M229 TaxID=3400188 RepID=UPI003CEFB7E3
MKTLLNSLLKKRYPKRRSPSSKTTSGFTMIELLVATIVATIIIVPILTFVVDILNRDVREQAKTNSEQELQAAVDYIAQDMSQAFYIYSSTDVGDIKALGNDVRPIPLNTGQDPILVFWKRKYEENVLDVDGCTVSATNDCLDDTFVYSLVAYYKIDETSTNSVWCDETPCPSRIARVEISDNPTDSLGNYINGEEPDNGYNTANIGNRETPANLVKGAGDFDPVTVLVNYIEEFELNSVEDNRLANIRIQGNGLRRIQTNTDCDNSPTYCPEATAQVGARSALQ